MVKILFSEGQNPPSAEVQMPFIKSQSIKYDSGEDDLHVAGNSLLSGSLNAMGFYAGISRAVNLLLGASYGVVEVTG